jgi:hypothetical protein
MRRLPMQNPDDELWDAIARELSLSGSPEPISYVPSGKWSVFGKIWALRLATILIVLILLVGTVAAAESSLREFPAAPGFTTVNWPLRIITDQGGPVECNFDSMHE